MFDKRIQKFLFLIIPVLIFAGVYLYLAEEYMKLPSMGWSKGEDLFSYEASSEYLEFFNKQIAYVEIEDRMSIIYLDNDNVSYKTYNEDLSLYSKGQIMSLSGVDEVYASETEDGIELLIRKEDLFSFYDLNEDFKLKRSFELSVNHPNYHISNSHLILKVDDHVAVVSSRGLIVLETMYKPYDLVTYVSYDKGFDYHYLSLIDQSRHIIHDTFDEKGHLQSSNVITNLVNDETRLTAIDFQVMS